MYLGIYHKEQTNHFARLSNIFYRESSTYEEVYTGLNNW